MGSRTTSHTGVTGVESPLVRERARRTEREPAMIKCGHCKNGHPTVAAVRACSETPNVPPSLRGVDIEAVEREMHEMEAQADREESERDAAAKVAKWDAETSLNDLIARVQALLVSRVVPESEWRWSRAIRRYIHGNAGVVTERGLRSAIGRLECYPLVRKPTEAPDPASFRKPEVEGLYRKGGRLYQVVRGKDSGQLYAKLVTFPPDGSRKRPTLTYARGAIFELTMADLVPAEEAQTITRKTGWCVFGHFLTNPVSIARGMGPVCWERYGARAKAEAKAS